MAGRLIENASYGESEDWEDETESKNIMKTSADRIYFTEMESLNGPVLKAGTVVCFGETMYIFDAAETITGTRSTTVQAQVLITVSGSTATASWTTDVLPEYDYLNKGYFKSTTEKYILIDDIDYAQGGGRVKRLLKPPLSVHGNSYAVQGYADMPQPTSRSLA